MPFIASCYHVIILCYACDTVGPLFRVNQQLLARVFVFSGSQTVRTVKGTPTKESCDAVENCKTNNSFISVLQKSFHPQLSTDQ